MIVTVELGTDRYRTRRIRCKGESALANNNDKKHGNGKKLAVRNGRIEGFLKITVPTRKIELVDERRMTIEV